MQLTPITLEGQTVILQPLALSHAAELTRAAQDGALYNLWYTSVPSPEQTQSYIEAALNQHQMGLGLPFVVVDKHTEQIIGSTRFCNCDLLNKRVEIGYTWYAASYQRTAINTEAKLMLLQHAFEHWQTIAVEFRTHWHNLPSRTAIARLGAKQDGVLRQHQQLPDGSYRDTVVFSILNSEWPAVKNGLLNKLAQPRK